GDREVPGRDQADDAHRLITDNDVMPIAQTVVELPRVADDFARVVEEGLRGSLRFPNRLTQRLAFLAGQQSADFPGATRQRFSDSAQNVAAPLRVELLPGGQRLARHIHGGEGVLGSSQRVLPDSLLEIGRTAGDERVAATPPVSTDQMLAL